MFFVYFPRITSFRVHIACVCVYPIFMIDPQSIESKTLFFFLIERRYTVVDYECLKVSQFCGFSHGYINYANKFALSLWFTFGR